MTITYIFYAGSALTHSKNNIQAQSSPIFVGEIHEDHGETSFASFQGCELDSKEMMYISRVMEDIEATIKHSHTTMETLQTKTGQLISRRTTKPSQESTEQS